MKGIYLDNAAATPLDKNVLKEMEKYFSESYGNAGSLHELGIEAKKAVEVARKKCALILGAKEKEIIFTSGGTESVNLAIRGVAEAKGRGRIIVSKVEHSCVLETCEYLSKKGFEIDYLDVDSSGIVDIIELEKKIRRDTILICVMYANNEIGSVQPVREIAKIAKKKNVLFFCDACQAAGFLDIDVRKIGVDLMALNGSKIYGPKGVGVLYKKEEVKIEPLIYGGGQEFGLRGGTENVPAIVGFAKALEIAENERIKEGARISELRDKLIEGILKIDGVKLNGAKEKRLPNNANFCFSGINGESLVLELDAKGVYTSTGSACETKKNRSYVLEAIGLSKKNSLSSVRFSLGRQTTSKEIDYVSKVLSEIVEKLRR